jgi:hypothetical protein
VGDFKGFEINWALKMDQLYIVEAGPIFIFIPEFENNTF